MAFNNHHKKAVLFDLDGVLVDSETLHLDIERRQLKSLGIEATDEDMHSIIGKPADYVFTTILDRYGVKTDIEQLVREKRRLFDEYSSRISLFPQTLGVITALSKNYQLALVTSSSAKYQSSLFDQFSLHPYFTTIINSDLVKNIKPHPEPYLLAMKNLDVAPQECFVVEDSVFGIISGKSAGATVIAVTHTMPRDMLSAADYIADSLPEAKIIMESYLRI